MATRILVLLLVLTGVASAQPAKLKIGIYAPSVDFGTAQARLAYVQGLAKAIEQNTGIQTVGVPYASLAALKKDGVDFAIVDAACYATNIGWKVLANAQIGGSTSRTWALFSNTADSMLALRGKKLAYMAAGCNDGSFIDNAMLDSEVPSSFWGGRVGEKEISGAVAAVSSYKTAQAVFAPVANGGKGLNKVFETGNVPNPAFVQLNDSVAGSIEGKVAQAVRGYGGGGAINGWSAADRGPYSLLAGQMQPVRKSGIFATPEAARIDANAVLVDPSTLKDTGVVAVRHHFVRPGGGRME